MRSRCSRIEEELRTDQVREAFAIRSLLWFGVASPHVYLVQETVSTRMSRVSSKTWRKENGPGGSRRRNQGVPSLHLARCGMHVDVPPVSRLVGGDRHGLGFRGKSLSEGGFSSLRGGRSGRLRWKEMRRKSSRSSRSGELRAVWRCVCEWK